MGVWSPLFRISKAGPKLFLKLSIQTGQCPNVWAGISIGRGSVHACSSTICDSQPLDVVILSDSIIVGAHYVVARGLMRPIVEWLRANGATVTVRPDSLHAADLVDAPAAHSARRARTEAVQAQERG